MCLGVCRGRLWRQFRHHRDRTYPCGTRNELARTAAVRFRPESHARPVADTESHACAESSAGAEPRSCAVAHAESRSSADACACAEPRSCTSTDAQSDAGARACAAQSAERRNTEPHAHAGACASTRAAAPATARSHTFTTGADLLRFSVKPRPSAGGAGAARVLVFGVIEALERTRL
jgi:hypothetical protein